ncbi:hypothetical protein [Bacillus cereus]|uniref:Uncharacterized protein n=1 Tax=Bacillus cereus TaxID=1396 RepID=A0A162NRU5_BACCE|nr:hypothetical protein [Bacillus cereus]KZD50185.1 hypothetical protein B4088_6382 [Bacillus cereus]
MLSIDNFVQQLKNAQNYYMTVKHVQLEEKRRLATEETELVMNLMDRIRPFYKKAFIHGEEAVLLYIFDANGKTFISRQAYLKSNGEVVYEIYDEDNYRKYVPNARIVEGYNIIPLEEFLLACPLYEVYQFLLDQKNEYERQADELIEGNRLRERFNQQFRENLKNQNF